MVNLTTWQALTDGNLTRLDLIVYAAMRIYAAATEEDLVIALQGTNRRSISQSLSKLKSLNYITKNGNVWNSKTVCIRPVRKSAETEGSGTYFLSPSVRKELEKIPNITNSTKSINMLNARPRAYTSVQASKSYKAVLQGGQWDALALLGLFHEKWLGMYQVKYSSSNVENDIRQIQLLIHHVESAETASWCIKALFSEDMAWVKKKTLDFLAKPDLVSRYVVPIAHHLRTGGNKHVEYQASEQLVGVQHKPRGL